MSFPAKRAVVAGQFDIACPTGGDAQTESLGKCADPLSHNAPPAQPVKIAALTVAEWACRKL